MGSPEKKRLKAEAKRVKKQAKAEVKAARSGAPGDRPSPGVRFAEAVRGVIYLVIAASLVAALALGQQGAVMSLDDIVDNLFAAWAGKIVLAIIALALLIYGLKNLRVVK